MDSKLFKTKEKIAIFKFFLIFFIKYYTDFNIILCVLFILKLERLRENRKEERADRIKNKA